MATTFGTPAGTGAGEHRFFLIATWLLALLTVGGFVLNLAAGRSTFAVPLVYHLHAFAFMGFIALYLTQVTLAARGSIALHRRLGQLAVMWIPAMVVLGIWLTFETLRVRGGPPVFGQAEFLVVNIFHILAFAGLAGAALRLRHRPDWHKRLMFGAIVLVSNPGIARLLPLPLFVPYTFTMVFLITALFPIAGMVMDRRVNGHIHPAWWWALLVPVAALLLGEAIDASGYASEWVAGHVAGTPGGERPPGPFMPPGL